MYKFHCIQFNPNILNSQVSVNFPSYHSNFMLRSEVEKKKALMKNFSHLPSCWQLFQLCQMHNEVESLADHCILQRWTQVCLLLHKHLNNVMLPFQQWCWVIKGHPTSSLSSETVIPGILSSKQAWLLPLLRSLSHEEAKAGEKSRHAFSDSVGNPNLDTRVREPVLISGPQLWAILHLPGLSSWATR